MGICGSKSDADIVNSNPYGRKLKDDGGGSDPLDQSAYRDIGPSSPSKRRSSGGTGAGEDNSNRSRRNQNTDNNHHHHNEQQQQRHTPTSPSKVNEQTVRPTPTQNVAAGANATSTTSPPPPQSKGSSPSPPRMNNNGNTTTKAAHAKNDTTTTTTNNDATNVEINQSGPYHPVRTHHGGSPNATTGKKTPTLKSVDTSSSIYSSYMNYESYATSADNTTSSSRRGLTVELEDQWDDTEDLSSSSSDSSDEEDQLTSTRHLEKLINMHAEAKRIQRNITNEEALQAPKKAGAQTKEEQSNNNNNHQEERKKRDATTSVPQYRSTVQWNKPVKNLRGSLTPHLKLDDAGRRRQSTSNGTTSSRPGMTGKKGGKDRRESNKTSKTAPAASTTSPSSTNLRRTSIHEHEEGVHYEQEHQQEEEVITTSPPKYENLYGDIQSQDLMIDSATTYVPPVHPKSKTEVDFLKHVLSQNFIFGGLTKGELSLFVLAMERYQCPPNTTLIEEGHMPQHTLTIPTNHPQSFEAHDTKLNKQVRDDYFYILYKGRVTISKNKQRLSHGKPGSCFGELSLLYNAPRAVTVTTTVPSKYNMKQQQQQPVGGNDRFTKSSSLVNSDGTMELFRLDRFTFRKMLANVYSRSSKSTIDILRKVELFQHLDTKTLLKIADLLTVVEKSEGSYIVRKGEHGEIFYIIQRGTCKVSEAGLGDTQYVDQFLGEGAFFGERALLTGEPRAANVVAYGGPVTLLALDKTTSEKMVGNMTNLVDRALDKRKLHGVPSFANARLEDLEYNKLMDCMTLVEFPRAGMLLTEEHQPLHPQFVPGLYFVKTGKLSQTASRGMSKMLGRGDYFGQSFLHGVIQGNEGGRTTSSGDKDKTPNYFLDPKTGEYRAHCTTKVLEDHTVCKLLRTSDIIKALGGLERLSRKTSVMAHHLDPTLNLNTLEKKTLVGAGTFGQVWLCRDTRDNLLQEDSIKCYALKCQTKRDLLKKKQVRGVIREKNLMSSLSFPFIIQLYNAFQDLSHIYMVMNALQGGELFSIIHTNNADGIPEDAAQFYAANIFDSLMYMHDRLILYRDLKPENILLDQNGYCNIIDLGFAKVVPEKTYTLCGTPLYLAPEIILSRGYDKGVDNWSFATLIYEMLMGFSPFYSHKITQMILFKRIVRADYAFPDWADCSNDAIDLIERILVVNPNHRLGALAGGDSDIRHHPWLSPIKTTDLLQRKLEAPWIPTVENEFEGTNFENWDHIQRKLERRNPKELILTPQEQERFKDFAEYI